MKRLSILSLAFVCSHAWAQNGAPHSVTPRNKLQFIERPGVMEFTGRLIARPLQSAAYKRLGLSEVSAQFNHLLAESRIADITSFKISEVDCYVIRVPQGETENSLASSLMKTGLFEYVEPDYRVFPQYTPNDPSLPSQWSQVDNNATSAWDICQGNAAVTIAVTDTGVAVTHEDLTTPRLPGANSATATSTADVKTESANGVAVVKDLHGHGTHTSGIACAEGNNGKGVTGVNIKGTKEFMVRVSDDSGGGASLASISIGALWAAQNGARIVTTSYSGVQNSLFNTTGTTLKSTYNSLWFYAAGNDGANYGAQFDWPDVMIIGSIDQGDLKSSFSAYGIFTDCFAPGGNIFNTYWDPNTSSNTYASLSGTSMATPYAAGVAAMVLSENPSYSAQRVQDIVLKSCINMFNDSNNYGWGRVNLWNAMGRVANSVTVGRGSVVSGALSSLFQVDNTSLVLSPGLTPTLNSPKIELVTEHNVPSYANNNYGEIDVMSKLSINTPMGSFTQQYQIYNFTTSTYETIGSGAVNGNMFEVVKTVNASNYADYIQNGKVKVKTQLFQFGLVPISNWQASYDQINVRTLRATQ